MVRKTKLRNPAEDKKLQEFMEDVIPRREPSIRIYRIELNEKRTNAPFRKQTRLSEIALSEAGDILEYLHFHFGPGTYLLRSVRSNGVYGPSRVVYIGARRLD
jgi:hypothetical protein